MEVRDHDPLICEAIRSAVWAVQYRKVGVLFPETATTWNKVADHHRERAANSLHDWLCACDAK